MNKTQPAWTLFAAFFAIFFATIGLLAMVSGHVLAADATSSPRVVTKEQELAAITPVFLQMEITSSCTEKGSVFRIINRGKKWPRHSVLRLYYSDDKSVMTERKLRLAKNQKVSFVIKKEKSKGRPIGMWIEPEWYERDFGYDAKAAC